MNLQGLLREAIAWVEKGIISTEEFEVLKQKIFLEENQRCNKVDITEEEDHDNVTVAKLSQENVEELIEDNDLLSSGEANRKVLLSDGTLYIKDFLDCSKDGIEYTRDCLDGTIYNADFVEVGKWCTCFGDGFIEFSNEGAKKHFKATGRTLPN